MSLTIKQITTIYGVTDRTVRRAIKEGSLTPLPESNKAGHYLFSKEQTEAWAARPRKNLPKAGGAS